MYVLNKCSSVFIFGVNALNLIILFGNKFPGIKMYGYLRIATRY